MTGQSRPIEGPRLTVVLGDITAEQVDAIVAQAVMGSAPDTLEGPIQGTKINDI